MELHQAVLEVTRKDKGIKPQAYLFLDEALKMAMQLHASQGKHGHVTGAELCEAVKVRALNEFGPMARYLLNDWGIKSTSDLGKMVYQMIELSYYSANEGDEEKDFDNVYDFEEAFDYPFMAKREVNLRAGKSI
jgi:uncharacterized repeat protein (TIGR04138 family)